MFESKFQIIRIMSNIVRCLQVDYLGIKEKMYAFSCHKVQCSRLKLLLHLELVYIHTNGVSGDIYACYVKAP